MIRNAKMDPSKRYLWSLTRIWDSTKPAAVFIGYCPTIEDEMTEDRTLKRYINLSKKLECGRMHSVNLMAHRADKGEDFSTIRDPIGNNNFFVMRTIVNFPEVKYVIPCWGNIPVNENTRKCLFSVYNILKDVRDRKLKCVGVNKTGMPKNILYSSYLKPLEDFDINVCI